MNRDNYNDYQPEAFQSIDLDKLRNIFRRSIGWLILIFLITNLSAYLFIRWTKPLFLSESEIKLELKSDAHELGIGLVENQNINLLSGEIELIKSRLFFNQVIQAMNLDISYYTIGKVLTDEKYKSSPFKVEFFLKGSQAYDQKYYVELLDNNTFLFSENEDFIDSRSYNYGDIVESTYADFKIHLTRPYNQSAEYQHYFIINSHESLLRYIENNLNVEPLNFNANTIRISFQDHNQMKAYDMVNTIDSVYLLYSHLEKSQENNQKINYLDHQLTQIEGMLENYEDYFESFTLKNRTSDLNQDLKQTLALISELDSQEYVLQKRLETISETYRSLKKENLAFINPAYDLPERLRVEINALNELLEDLNNAKLFYKETTNVYALKSQRVDAAVNSLVQQIADQQSSILENLKEISKRKNKLESNFALIPEQNTEYNKKQRFFKLYEEFYLGLMQTKAEFEIAQAGTTPDFKILSPATMPIEPISPNKAIIHGIGLVSGIVFGLLFVAFRYLLNNKILSVNELERLTNTAILGTVPALSFNKIARLVIRDEPRSAVSESLRTIRTNIEFMLAGKQQKILSVTSTIGGEGKTFIAANLSAILSLSKRKTVVVDLDLRKPKIHEAFGEENSAKGVSTLLINKHAIDECIRPTSLKHLDYIPAGPTPPNPSELLLNNEFSALLDQLKERYDIIILDTPPVGVVTDGIIVMRKADLPIYIFRANYSRKEFLRILNRIQNINKIHNIAVILNAVPQMMSKYYGSGYYEEKSKSGTFNRIKMIFSNT